MSYDKLDLKINLDVNVTDLEKAEILRKEIGKMAEDLARLGRNANASIKNLAGIAKIRLGGTGQADTRAARNALTLERGVVAELNRQEKFRGRMASQRRREESAQTKAEKESQDARERVYKQNLAFNTNIARQRAKEESAAEKAIRDQVLETSRLRDKEAKKAKDEARRAEREHAKALRDAQAGAQRAAGGVGRVAGIGAGVAAGLGYGAERAIHRGVSTRMELDTAETNLKIFGDKGDGKKFTVADIKKLRRGPMGLDAEAIRNGVSVKAAIEAFTEVNKAGLQNPLEMTRTLLAGTTALELDPRATTKLMGTMARNMGAAATPARVKKAINALAVGAREDPTQANEIVEGMNRAQSLLAMSKGFTEEDLVGLVSGGQSVGIQPGKAGTFLPAIAREILQGNDKFLSKGKRKELNWAAKNLGFGSAKDLATQFAGPQGKQVYYGILESLSKMPEAQRAQVANALAGGQWSDELLQHVNGLPGMRKTDAEINDPRNANFLDDARNDKMKSWAGIWNQSKAIFTLFWESFGVGFDGILREINAFFLDLNGKFNYDQVSEYVRNGLDGLKEGLGLETWKDGLAAIFPSDIGGLGDKIRDFAKGFGEGVKAIGSTLRSIGSMFGVGGGAEALGSVSAKFLLLSTACVALAPVLGILGGLASVILGLASVTRAAASVLGLGGGAAAGGLGGGAVAGALASVARILSGGFIVGLAGAIGSMRGEISTLVIDAVKPLISAIWQGLKSAFSVEGLKAAGSTILDELTPAWMRRWLDGDDKTAKPDAKAEGSHWTDPPARTGTSEAPAAKSATDKLVEETQKQTDLLQQQLQVDQRALEATQQQSLRNSRDAQVRSLLDQSNRYVRGIEGSVGRAGTGGPAINHSVPGGSLGNNLTGQNRNGIIGGDGASPEQKSGGSRSWRNNNPGNIEFGPYARSMGATGSDGRFARFPSYEAGRRAQEKLLFESNSYKNLTLGQAIRRWAPGSENNVPAYIAAMGGDSSKRMSEYTAEQRGKLLDAMQRHEGWRPGTVAGGGGTRPSSGGSAGQSTGHLGGSIDMEGRSYAYGSGGHRGANSIPIGSHEITPNQLGPWGRAHGAIGLGGNRIWDATLGRMREGIEMHQASSAKMLSAGCIAVAREQWAAFRTHVLDMVRRTGRAYLNVGPDGRASITSSPQDPTAQAQASVQRTRDLAAGVNKPPQSLGDLNVAGSTPASSLPDQVPTRGGSGAGANYGRTGHNITNNINVTGNNKSPEELAGTVQRHLQDSMNRRTHDFDGFA